MSQAKVILIRESLFASIGKDVVTFGALVGSFWANHRFIGSTSLDVVLAICFFIATSARAKRVELTPEQAIEYLQQEAAGAPTQGAMP